MDMNPEEMEQKKQMVIGICTCKTCPSFVQCEGEQGAFCFPTIGKSSCITEEKGCVCGNCPATAQMGLKHGYYCTKGSEMELLKAEGGGMEAPAEAPAEEAPAEPAPEAPAEAPAEEAPAEEAPAEAPAEEAPAEEPQGA